MYKASSLTLVTVLAGCTTFGNPHPESDISAALEQHDYARAAAIIEQTKPRHPEYPALQEQYPGIRQASKAYRQHIIQQAQELGRKQQWEDAFRLLDDNRDKVLNPAAMDELSAALTTLEERQLNQLLAERRQAQATAMLANDRLEQQLANFHAADAKQERQTLAEERQQLIQDLTTLGEYFGEREQWMLARDLLRSAHQLAPQTKPSPVLAQAQQVLNNEEQRARAKRNLALQTEAEQRMSRYPVSYTHLTLPTKA